MISDRNFKKLYLLIAVAFTIIIAIGYSQYMHFVTQNALVKSSNNKILLYKVYSEIQNAETSQRGYLLTKDSLYRRSVRNIAEKVFFQLGSYANSSAKTSKDNAAANKLLDLASKKLTELDFTIKLLDEGLADKAMSNLKTDEGELLMNEIELLVKQMIQQEQEGLSKILAKQSRYEKIIYLLLLLFIFIGLYLIYNIAMQIVPLITKLEEKNEVLEASNKIKAIEIQRRKKIEEKNDYLISTLTEKNKELNHFAYIASHDLQEPLRTVSNFINIFKEEFPEILKNEDANQYFNFITGATTRMKALIEGLMRFSRIGRSGNYELINLNDLVKTVLEDLNGKIQETNAIIKIEQLPETYILPIEIHQLFQNLISNGLKFVPKDRTPEIHLEVEEDKNFYIFSIKDNGIGIKKQHQSKIFEMFARLHSEHDYEGKGMGLSFCKKIVELHEGKIWIESVEGIGSKFYFSISKNLINEEA